MTEAEKGKKKKKRKGPIRVEAVVPALVIFALIYGYFFFFFDNHLRKASEYFLTQVHGAEVNIGDITTSFWNASISVKDIQITDKNKPERDLFRVGEIRFKTLWDGLLRAKVVVDDAAITNIQALVPRERPGRVLPPPPPGQEGILAKAERQIVEQTRSKLQDNFLGDIMALLSGVDVSDQLKNIQQDLKSSLRLKELEAELNKKKEEWEKRLKNLPDNKYFKSLEKRFNSIDWDEKDPLKFAKNLQSANDLIKEARSKLKEIDQAQSDLRGDLQNYKGLAKDLDEYIQQDIKDLQNRLQIPSIDPKDFTQQFFMGQIQSRLVSLRKYYEVAKKYMPPKKTEEEKAAREAEALVPRERGEGQNFSFPITKGYPKFWLKRAEISSEVSSSSEYSGNVAGEILDITSHPQYLKRPARVNLTGDFPKQNISGLDLKAVIDHTTEVPKQTVDLKIAAFPMGQLKLSDSPDVKLNINDSVASVQLGAALTEGSLRLDTRSQYNKLAYEIQAKEKMVQEILHNVFEEIPQITLNAKVQGAWDNLKINLNSNLGQAMAKAFGRQLQLKINEAKAKIRNEIDQRIDAEKEKLQAQIQSLTSELEKSLGVKKSEADKVIKDINASIDKEQKSLIKPDDVKKLKEKGKELLKGLGL